MNTETRRGRATTRSARRVLPKAPLFKAALIMAASLAVLAAAEARNRKVLAGSPPPAFQVPAASASLRDAPVPEGFVPIPAGTFMMGSPAEELGRFDNEARRQVTVSGFFLGTYPVTQKEYEGIMGINPSTYYIGASLPVTDVTWYNAIMYCNKRSAKEGLESAYLLRGNDVRWNRSANGYRLPTEAEWEYACRAGTVTPFYTGATITTDQANYSGNALDAYSGVYAGGVSRNQTSAVGSFAPNRWGLYDMHGNVFEWCWDWFGEYALLPEISNPEGALSGSGRVGRGGSWVYGSQHLRSAYRGSYNPKVRNNRLGFRLARNR